MMSHNGGKWQNLTASEDDFSNYTYILKNCILTLKDIENLIYNFLKLPCYNRTTSTTFNLLSTYCNTNRYLLSRQFS